jgi:23S rRNA pseudouridine955/2504/2580 synthase
LPANRLEGRSVGPDDAGIRLDRWFKRHYPALGHGQLEKLLRTGQVRLDGLRAKASARLAAGQLVRIPPSVANDAALTDTKARPLPPPADGAMRALQKSVLYRDADIIVINKPAGLATQGGSGQTRHLDQMLDALKFGAPERPRLVHRLDKDTSGVLVLARSAKVAAEMGEVLRRRTARKIYWALTVGVPRPAAGRIDLPLLKLDGSGGERVRVAEGEGQKAETEYVVLATAGSKAAWLALSPLTGRTHQLRVHCQAIGTPIQGDGKYGGAQAHLGGEVGDKLHLHARRIVIPRPGGGVVDVSAPLPEHMAHTWRLFGFDPDDQRDPFGDRPEKPPRNQPRSNAKGPLKSRPRGQSRSRGQPRPR